MRNADLFRTLSGCKFYRSYQQILDGRTQPAPRSPARPRHGPGHPPGSGIARATRNRVFARYGAVLGVMFVGVLVLLIAPMWLVHPPYGRACLLSLPPMLLCALSWMAGAWWGSGKNPHVLMAVTLGAIPVRVLFVLVWTWLALSIPGIVKPVFVIALMFHWAAFAVPEIAMVIELNGPSGNRPPSKTSGA